MIGIGKTVPAAVVKFVVGIEEVKSVGLEEVKSVGIRRARPVGIKKTGVAGGKRANAADISGIDMDEIEEISAVGIEIDTAGVGKASKAGVGRANMVAPRRWGDSNLSRCGKEMEEWKCCGRRRQEEGGGPWVGGRKQRKKKVLSPTKSGKFTQSHAGNALPRLSFPPPPFAVLLDGACPSPFLHLRRMWKGL